MSAVDGNGQGQAGPACDQQGRVKTPERVGGEVTKVDMAQGRVTVRGSDGTLHEFQASKERLQNASKRSSERRPSARSEGEETDPLASVARALVT